MKNLIKTGLFALLLAFASCQKTEPVVKPVACDCQQETLQQPIILFSKVKINPTSGKLTVVLQRENNVWRELCNPDFTLAEIQKLTLTKDSIVVLTGKISKVCENPSAVDGKTKKQFYTATKAELSEAAAYQSPCHCELPKPNKTTVTGKLVLNGWGEWVIVMSGINEILGSNQQVLVRQAICNQQTPLNLIKQQQIKPDSLFQFEAQESEICSEPNAGGVLTTPAFYRFYEVISIKN
jgi:hypothetical protein